MRFKKTNKYKYIKYILNIILIILKITIKIIIIITVTKNIKLNKKYYYCKKCSL